MRQKSQQSTRKDPTMAFRTLKLPTVNLKDPTMAVRTVKLLPFLETPT